MNPNPHPIRRPLIIGIVLIIAFGITIFQTGKSLMKTAIKLNSSDKNYSTVDGRDCDIASVPMVGELWAAEGNAYSNSSNGVSAESVIANLEAAEHDDSIKGIILHIDSPGGSSVAGKLIADALKRLKKPSVALIGDQGDSAAYLAATGAGIIIASPNSDVGDIGVTGSYLDQSGSNARNGDKFISIAAGAYKDVGNPDSPLTAAGYALLKAQVDEMYDNFIHDVAVNRSMSEDAVRKVANGLSYVASAATSTGLIDSLGDAETARQWFTTKLGKGSDPVLCQ